MGKPVIGLLLAGSAKPFIDLKQEQREKYLLAMANSPWQRYARAIKH